jgi:hypothetical protein
MNTFGICRKRLAPLLTIILSAMFIRSACSQPVTMKAAEANAINYATNACPSAGKWHSIIVTPPKNLPKIHFYDKLNPVWWFENSDDPMPPAWYRPNDKHRTLKWHFRNPLHNFDSYVIGITDKKFVRSGRYPKRITNPHGGWDFAICGRRILFLPCFSYQRGKFEFYLGWRNHGSFGIKLNYSKSNLPPNARPVNKSK